jgi:hypothetical protein
MSIGLQISRGSREARLPVLAEKDRKILELFLMGIISFDFINILTNYLGTPQL